jgi:periplasmic protein TonB
MKLCLLPVALTVVFASCSSTSTTPALAKLGYCPGLKPATEQFDTLVPTFRVPPLYPREAIKKGLSGTVLMIVWVTSTGSAEQVCVVESSPQGVFDAAAAQAVAKWKFKKKVVEGVPMPQQGVQTIDFKLE